MTLYRLGENWTEISKVRARLWYEGRGMKAVGAKILLAQVGYDTVNQKQK